MLIPYVLLLSIRKGIRSSQIYIELVAKKMKRIYKDKIKTVLTHSLYKWKYFYLCGLCNALVDFMLILWLEFIVVEDEECCFQKMIIAFAGFKWI